MYEIVIIVNVSFCIEVFCQGSWTQLDSLQDPELKRIAATLPKTVLSSRADSTTIKYTYAFRKWKEWAEAKREVAVFPVQDIQFALYLQHVSETTKSRAAVETAVTAASSAHQLAGLRPVSCFPFVQVVLSGLQRTLAKPKKKKEPVTVEMLAALVQSSDGSLTDLRVMAMVILAFAAFLHCDELVKLRCCNVLFNPSGLSINLPRSKTDQYREGSFVLIAPSSTPTCPVAMLNSIPQRRQWSSPLRIFCIEDSENKKGGPPEKFWPH